MMTSLLALPFPSPAATRARALASLCLLVCASTGACVVVPPAGGDADTEGGSDSATSDGGQDGADGETGEGPAVDGIATIEGFITDAQGEPLAGVVVNRGDSQAETDDTGHFEFDTAAADGETIVVELNKDGFVRGHERFVARDGAVNVVRGIM
ncbi:MAG: hypothetical protein AAF721_24490, partial [Myxococcota bacterium]